MSSCTTPAYVVNSRNVPQLDQAKDFAGTAGISAAGGEVQTAYAVTKHFAVMANGYLVSQQKDDEDAPTYHSKHIPGEGAVGYFARNKVARFEVFCGHGIGHDVGWNRYEFFDQDKRGIITSDYRRFFLQPSISTIDKQFTISLTARITAISFTRFSHQEDVSGLLVYHPTGPYRIFIEPAVTTRPYLGGERFWGIFQARISGPQGNRDVYFDYTPVEILLGIQDHTSKRSERVY